MWRFNPHYEVLYGENLVHLLCFFKASESRSLDMTGSDWGLRKKTQRHTYRKAWDWVGPALLMRDAGNPPLPPSAFIYTARMGKWDEVQVMFSWVQLRRQQEQHSCGMFLFTTDYLDYVNISCFPCKITLLNLASPWLGPCLSAKEPFDRAMLIPRSIATASVFLLTRQPC
jgi:hypothetical protein